MSDSGLLAYSDQRQRDRECRATPEHQRGLSGSVTITFVDSGVLIAAAQGTQSVSRVALEILADPTRTFASSELVKLEVLPKVLYQHDAAEAEFYEAYFAEVAHWAEDLTQLLREAERIASAFGLTALEAIHIAAALQTGAEEFITTEHFSQPVQGISRICVISIRAQIHR